MLLTGIIPFALAADVSDSVDNSTTVEYNNISIGAGGLFTNTLINPLNSNCYVATCDMGGIYYTTNAGEEWNRNNCSRMYTACYAEDGTLFTGGYGLYSSNDNGQTIQLIYPNPNTVQYSVSLYGRNGILRVADGYDNGYVVAITVHENYLYFITINWNEVENLRLYRSLRDGSEPEILYTETVGISPLESNYQLIAEEKRILCANENEIWCYDLTTKENTVLYTPIGEINDFEKIDNTYFILDDMDEYTNILYTDDFVDYRSLNEYNTLTDTFIWNSTEYKIEWHFRYICGNNKENIFLCFYTPLEGRSNNGGVIKFDGTQFIWVYDQVWETQIDIAWNSAGIDMTYGICSDPNDDNHCLMTNMNTIYDLYYDSESNRKVTTLHSRIKTVNGYTCYESTGLDVQTTYFVRENPFDSQNIVICTTDLGLQISYDGGTSFRRMDVLYQSIYNTCYDLYFDENTEGMMYGLWSSRHDAPYNAKISDINAVGGFGVSYDGGITWDFNYSSGLPSNSIPVRMSVLSNDDELTIAVATFNNGFYISYDSGKTFTSINDGMVNYNGMIWGEDVIIVDDDIYCLTAYYDFDDPTPSYLYRYNTTTGILETIDMGELIIAKSMTYDEKAGLYVCATAYPYWEWIEKIGRNYYVNRGGGVYKLVDDRLEIFFENNDPGVYNCAFSSDGVMYITGEYGTIYTNINGTFDIYVDGLFPRLKNISFSNDEKTLYITTFGGGTYRMPTIVTESITSGYTVTFTDYDGTIISTQTVTEDNSAVLPENPTREPDADYHYTFSGWDISADAVYCDLIVTAQYAAEAHTPTSAMSENDGTHTISCSVCNEVISTTDCTDSDGDYLCDACGYQLALPEYTVTFMNYDGTILSTQTVAEGDAAVLPETPTREPDANYHYSFSKWSESTDYIDCDLTVYACYVYKSHTSVTRNATDATCTENGYTGDIVCSSCGYVISTGETVPATGHTDGSVVENGDDTHTVICSVCGEKIRSESCTDTDSDGYCDECGYKFPVYSTVTFIDWDGTEISTQTVLEGEAAILPNDPAREPDAESCYTFAGWNTDVTNVQSNLTVTAVYTLTAHTPEIRGAYDATCTEEGYTGDTYCSTCGMLLEEGTVIPMTDHIEGDAETNNDGTHTSACTVCGTEINTETCADYDSDGYCDVCAYEMNMTKFAKVSTLTNGKQYLIVGSGYALRSTIAAESVSLTESNGHYVTADEIPDDMLWTYNNGYLYTTYNGQTYYLTAYRGFNSSYTLSVETQSWWASTWSYRNGSLSTQINDWRHRTTKYLNINNGTVTLSSSGTITLYQLEN